MSMLDCLPWREINKYEGNYAVSTDGQIKRNKRDKRNRALKLLKSSVSKFGYHYINLYDGNKYIREYIHRLVYEAFNGPIEKGKQINHIDGIKANNSLSNLEVVTAKENTWHAIKLGLKDKCKGGKKWIYKIEK